MRLLLLATHYWEKGGIEVYVKTLERAARELGAQVEILTISAGWIPAEPNEPKKKPGGSPRLSRKQKVQFLGRLIGAALTRHYDAVLCAHPYLSPFARMWRNVGGPRYVAFAYGIEVWEGLSENRRRGMIGAENVATISAYTASRLATQCGIAAGKISMLAPCVPEAYLGTLAMGAEREAARRRWGAGGRKVILTVGRQSLAESYKGADMLIRALPAIRREVGEVLCLVAGGGDGLGALKQLTEEMGLGGAVQILGLVSAADLLALYDACDVFVLPSKGEGFGIVLLEAAARGRPSVGFNVGGIADAVCDGRTGLLVDESDPAGLAVATAKVLAGRAPAHFQQPNELRRIVVEHFGYARFRERLAQLISSSFPDT